MVLEWTQWPQCTRRTQCTLCIQAAHSVLDMFTWLSAVRVAPELAMALERQPACVCVCLAGCLLESELELELKLKLILFILAENQLE